MNEELESQLSAMFDDELPAAECELLARRLARDEQLQGALGPLCGDRRLYPRRAGRAPERARWPAGSVPPSLAEPAPPRQRWSPAAQLRGATAGGSRWPALGSAAGVAAVAILWMRAQAPARAAPARRRRVAAGRATVAAARRPHAGSRGRTARAGQLCGTAATVRTAPLLVPPTELANYIVAHSAYSGPLMRRNLLSASWPATGSARRAVEPRSQPQACRRCQDPRSSGAGRALALSACRARPWRAARRWPPSRAQWLERMNDALNTRNYDGMFSHWQGGRVETLRIIHRVLDGAVTERLESLDGSGRSSCATARNSPATCPTSAPCWWKSARRGSLLSRLPAIERPDRQFYD